MSKQKLAGRIGVLAASFMLVIAGTVPAQAAAQVLCTGYDQCSSKGYVGAKDYKPVSAKGSMYWNMYGGHNCTNYVAFRMVTNNKMANSRPWNGDGNALNWGPLNKSKLNNTPGLGSVAWWPANYNGAYSAGHVAYVEKVVSANEIIVSEDNYGGNFYIKRITKTSGAWPKGFIHFKDLSSTKSLTAAPTPTISGTTKLGSTLTAKAGAWQPSPVTFKYQWKRDGKNISGASATTYKLAQADVGKKLSVAVTGSKPGYKTATKISASTAEISANALTGPFTVPKLSGKTVHGQTLKATPGTWQFGVSMSYQWKRDGKTISKATGLSYKLGEADIGKKISFTATASKSGFASVSKTSAATATITSQLGSTLKSGAKLTSNQALYSTNGWFKLIQQSDGNLVLYKMTVPKKVVWANNRFGAGNWTVMQKDGNLVQYSSTKKVKWAIAKEGRGGVRLVVQNDGNVVIYTAKNKVVWATNTAGR